MGIITIHTTQNIDIDYEIGGLGERILARIIDFVIFIPFLFIGIFFSVSGSQTAIIIFYAFLALIFVFYDLVCEVFFNGQSLGKRAVKIRVISLDGARPKFSQFLLRWLFRMVDFSLTGGLCGLVTAAVTENGQRVGDLVAGTVLIKTSPRTTMNNIAFPLTESAYEPVFTQASELNDSDIALIHEVIATYFKNGNNQLVYNMADKIRNHLGISLPPDMNSMQFLQTIIKDYTHITSQADRL
ncbi:RDD family protein [Mucilaginibacter gotjawali]|uniref:RDD family protein n=2 Tax=Mucilaginibacter gotjawali TaxID=1550579 RepID=A0A120MYZ4_9SPHI|nr:RDD family protein [Mucilaginibacter gotjawali]MBB3055269.1 putative RDD family membrane protein YckC [Mucilaginibacter gotjawali]BAU56112.1 RDD family protein [Mucilaginibacter gotjawali]